MVVKDCPECHGTGKVKVGEKECPVCEGWGDTFRLTLRLEISSRVTGTWITLELRMKLMRYPVRSATGRVLFQFTTPARPAGGNWEGSSL